MNTSCYIFIATLLCQSLMAQSNIREAMLNGLNREAVVKQSIERLRGKSEQDLIAETMSPIAQRDSEIAAAVLLIREHKSQSSIDAALEAIQLEMPAGLNDWEEANDWRLAYPVAAEASLHPDLMPQLIQRTLDGTLPESVVGFVLLRFQTENNSPAEHLATLLKTNLTPAQRQRCERLIAILKGEKPKEPPSKGSAEKPASTMPAVVVLPGAKKAEPKATSLLALAPNEEPALSTPQSIIIVLIMAVTGLLWLLVKKRK